MKKTVRSVLALIMFMAFAAGGILVSYLLLPFTSTRGTGQRIVRAIWRFLIAVLVRAGLISVDVTGLRNVVGKVIVANHPSLIDVVILTAFLPGVYSVAKSELKDNPFFGRIVDKVMLVNDDRILDGAKEILSENGNILVFPEGTRTPRGGERVKLKRGAAQLAIRLGVPVVPVRIEMSRRILAKSQSILDMGGETVRYSFFSCPEIIPPHRSVANRKGAIALTDDIERALFGPVD